jgi:hydrogenase maturation factor
LLALAVAHHFVDGSRIRDKLVFEGLKSWLQGVLAVLEGPGCPVLNTAHGSQENIKVKRGEYKLSTTTKFLLLLFIATFLGFSGRS